MKPKIDEISKIVGKHLRYVKLENGKGTIVLKSVKDLTRALSDTLEVKIPEGDEWRKLVKGKNYRDLGCGYNQALTDITNLNKEMWE